jgi:hypothetical protein
VGNRITRTVPVSENLITDITTVGVLVTVNVL